VNVVGESTTLVAAQVTHQTRTWRFAGLQRAPLAAPLPRMRGSPSRPASKFVPRATVAKNAADGLKAAAARASLNVEDEPLAVEYANGEQGQVITHRDRQIATGATAKVMQDANIGGGSFKIPRVKGQLPKTRDSTLLQQPPARQPRCAASPALLASHARVAPC